MAKFHQGHGRGTRRLGPHKLFSIPLSILSLIVKSLIQMKLHRGTLAGQGRAGQADSSPFGFDP